MLRLLSPWPKDVTIHHIYSMKWWILHIDLIALHLLHYSRLFMLFLWLAFRKCHVGICGKRHLVFDSTLVFVLKCRSPDSVLHFPCLLYPRETLYCFLHPGSSQQLVCPSQRRVQRNKPLDSTDQCLKFILNLGHVLAYSSGSWITLLLLFEIVR